MSNELQQLRKQLEALARQHRTISYRQLAELAEIPAPQVIRRLTYLLEEITRQDYAQNTAPSVACLAVSQTEPTIPRAGYFMLLRELGVYHGPVEGDQAAAFHAEQLQQLFARFDQD